MDLKAPEWVEFDAGKWLVGTMEMDAMTEFVYFRLCLHAYEKGVSVVRGTPRRNCGRCKVDLDTYNEAIEMLIEMEKIEVNGDEISIPTTEKRLNKASSAMNNRQIGAAKSRRRQELKQTGMAPKEIDAQLRIEFPDNKTDDQADDQAPKERKKETQTDTKGGVGGLFDDQKLPDTKPKGPQFDDFWAKVPEKTAKARAEKAWGRLSQKDRQAAIDCCVRWFAKWRKDHPSAAWIHPSRYLIEKRFNDQGSGPSPHQAEVARQKSLDDLAEAIKTGKNKFLLNDVKRATVETLIETNRVTVDQVRKAGL